MLCFCSFWNCLWKSCFRWPDPNRITLQIFNFLNTLMVFATLMSHTWKLEYRNNNGSSSFIVDPNSGPVPFSKRSCQTVKVSASDYRDETTARRNPRGFICISLQRMQFLLLSGRCFLSRSVLSWLIRILGDWSFRKDCTAVSLII